MNMFKLSSREVQNRFGDFVASVEDDVVCVTRHGRPLFWAMSDRQVREDDPSVLIGRLLLLRGQVRQEQNRSPSESFATVVEREIDQVIKTDGLTQESVTAIIDERR